MNLNLVMPDSGRTPITFEWTDEARRKVLDRRRKEREAARLAPDGDEQRTKKSDRRQQQICFVCHSPFEPSSHGQTICPSCRLDGIRGGTGWPGKKF